MEFPVQFSVLKVVFMHESLVMSQTLLTFVLACSPGIIASEATASAAFGVFSSNSGVFFSFLFHVSNVA